MGNQFIPQVRMPELDKLMKQFGIDYARLKTATGMVKPRIIFMVINEACYTFKKELRSIEDIDNSNELGTKLSVWSF